MDACLVWQGLGSIDGHEASARRSSLSAYPTRPPQKHKTAKQGTVFYPLSTQGQGPDRYNPIEQIVVGSPAAGGNYTITVGVYYANACAV